VINLLVLCLILLLFGLWKWNEMKWNMWTTNSNKLTKLFVKIKFLYNKHWWILAADLDSYAVIYKYHTAVLLNMAFFALFCSSGNKESSDIWNLTHNHSDSSDIFYCSEVCSAWNIFKQLFNLCRVSHFLSPSLAYMHAWLPFASCTEVYCLQI